MLPKVLVLKPRMPADILLLLLLIPPLADSAQPIETFVEKQATTQHPVFEPLFSTQPDSLFLAKGDPLTAKTPYSTTPHRVFISPIRNRVVDDRSDPGQAFPQSTLIFNPNPHHLRVSKHDVDSQEPLSPTSSKKKPLLNESSLLVTHPLAAISICLLVAVLILCTIIGNCMVCLAVLMVRKLKQQPANLLLVSLAVADFCVGLLVMPIALVNILEDRWILGEVVCRLWTTADLTLCTASILNLCMISVDRYMAVTRALRYSATRTRRKVFGYIAIVWVGALLVSIAPLIVLPLKSVDDSCQVSQNQLYQIYATIISFYGPCLIMVIVYVQMWRAAKRLQKRDRMAMKWSLALAPVTESPASPKKPTSPREKFIKSSKCSNSSKNSLTSNSNSPSAINREKIFTNLNPMKKFQHKHSSPLLTSHSAAASSTTATVAAVIHSPLKKFQRPSGLLNAVRMPLLHSRPHQEKGEDKARKTLGVIMSVFIICWVPFFILALVKSQYVIYVPKWLDMLVLWLGYSNSMLNPLIYCKYNREFRVPFREMLCCRFSTIQVVMRNESFHTKFGAPRLACDFKHSTINNNNNTRAGKSNSNGTIRTAPNINNNNNNNNNNNSINSFPTNHKFFHNQVKRNSSPCTIEYMKSRSSGEM